MAVAWGTGRLTKVAGGCLHRVPRAVLSALLGTSAPAHIIPRAAGTASLCSSFLPEPSLSFFISPIIKQDW